MPIHDSWISSKAGLMILRRVDGVWKITTMRITLNIPYAFPGQ